MESPPNTRMSVPVMALIVIGLPLLSALLTWVIAGHLYPAAGWPGVAVAFLMLAATAFVIWRFRTPTKLPPDWDWTPPESKIPLEDDWYDDWAEEDDDFGIVRDDYGWTRPPESPNEPGRHA
jgi:hypothetical protein